MYSPDPQKKSLCEVGKRMYDRSLVSANDGNISWRIAENEVLISPSMVCKGDMTPEMILKVDMEGNLLEGEGKPSSELLMHLMAYQTSAEIRGVVHAHPAYICAFAVANMPLEDVIYPTAYSFFGKVPVTPYGTSTTRELAESVRDCILEGKRGVLLANHGALTCAANLWDAYFLLERLESYAQIAFLAKQLGGGRVLTPREQERLRSKMQRQREDGRLY